MPCRTGEHLKQCKEFQCNGQFKCPAYYCIDWHYQCDGKWDCLSGFDELNNTCIEERMCTNLFRCKGSSLCVHTQNICDHTKHCPMGDDENLCSLSHVFCSPKCSCFKHSIICKSRRITHFMQLDKFKFVHLLYCKLSVQYSFVTEHVVSIVCLQANLTSLCWLLHHRNSIQTLNFAKNRVTALINFCFVHTEKLLSLDVSDNLIVLLQINTFSNLGKLRSLNLSGNPVTTVEQGTYGHFCSLEIYSVLSVGYFESSNHDIFHDLALRRLETNNFRICCLVTEKSSCSVSFPWYFSCRNLLFNAELKISSYIINCIIFLGNFALLLAQFIKHSLKTKERFERFSAFRPVLIAVNFIDISLVLPIMILWIADLLYDNTFSLKSAEWSQSIFCLMVFACFLFYNLASPLMLGLSCIIRLRVVEKPMSSKFKHKHFVIKCVVLVIMFCLSWSILSTLMIKCVELDISERSIPLSICLPFVDPSNKLVMSKILSVCTTFIQVSSCLGIAPMYCQLYSAMKKSKETAHTTQDACAKRQSDNVYLKIHLCILVTKNFLCWIPCCVVYITTLFLNTYSIPLVLWTTVAIMPLNAIVNPIIEMATRMRNYLKQVFTGPLTRHQLLPVTHPVQL